MGWKHHQTVGVPSPNSLQISILFSKSIKSSTFHIFLDLTYPLRKIISFPKSTQKFTENRQTMVNEISIDIKRCSKREQDLGRRAEFISDVRTAVNLGRLDVFYRALS